MDEVLPDLFISGVLATKEDNLKAKNIKTVLTVMQCPLRLYPGSEINFEFVQIDDFHSEDIAQHFDRFVEIIRDGLQKGRVLVHCQAGMSRSTTAILAYMVATFNIPYMECLKSIRKNHSFAFPNAGFEKQLEQFSVEVAKSWVASPSYVYHGKKVVELVKGGDKRFTYFFDLIKDREDDFV